MATRGRGRPPHPDVLTPAEWSVLNLYRHGLPRREIARLRGTSEYAVRYHLRNISSKLGTSGTRALRMWPGAPRNSQMSTADRRSRRFQPMSTDLELTLGTLAQVSMLCRSADEAEAWYRDVLQLPEIFRFGELVFFDCDGTRLYLRQVPDEEFRKSSTPYFLVPDMSSAAATLEGRGVRFLGAPHMIFKDDETGVEEWFSFFDDPDGNTLSLLARVGGT